MNPTTEQPISFKGEPSGLEVAVIGMAGRFPGARNLTEFWHNLQQSVESISPLEDELLLAQGVPAETLADPNYVKVGGVLEDSDLFDATYFGFSPREAEILDPQQRLFLETAVEALETAGYDTERYPGSIGIYGGAGMNGYLLNLYGNAAIRREVSPYELFVANDKDFLTTRVSYKLNLTGPSVDIQTACSSSLVAVHVACQSLLSGECDIALAGGVAVSKQLGYRAQAGSIYAPDGRCRAFDARAAGTVSGNGVGIVVLKRLEDALADGDTIDAVIKGSAINNDGAHKMSYTAPCVEAQAAVIQAALIVADVSPDSIRYIEAHGTGTALGDPIELAALTQAFEAQGGAPPHTCAIGSVKTNIGHLDAAAGISGFIKTVLALKHNQIPASLHFQQPNPQIDFNNSPFYVNATLSDWPQGNLQSDWQSHWPRRAGISSFGIGGTNAHVILEAAPATIPATPVGQPQILALSAKTPIALELAALNLADYLEQKPDISLADTAYTLQVGRRTFPYRRTLVCTQADAASQLLRAAAPSTALSPTAAEQPTPIFLFPGQGSQYVRMGRGLYQSQPVFKQALDRCARCLEDKFPLIEILYPPQTSQTSNPSDHTPHAQPILFSIEYALAQLWLSWGIAPTATIGHSLGEYVAACMAGVFDLETALELVATRGQLMAQMPEGAMLSVSLSPEAVQPWLGDEISLAASNGPQLCAVSGSKAAIASLQSCLEKNNIRCRPLRAARAFHSPMMEPAIAPFVDAISQVTLNPPTMPFISSVTGTWITRSEATDPSYWGRQIRQPVRFSEGIAELMKLAEPVFLEIGPGCTLTTLTRQHFSSEASFRQAAPAIHSLPHPKSREEDTIQIAVAVGQLWEAGIAIDWETYHGDRRHRRIPLPTYPFERQRYWVEFNSTTPTHSSDAQPAQSPNNIELKPDLTDWFYSPSWERCLPTMQALDPTARPRWLIFSDIGSSDIESSDIESIGSQLKQKIEQAGQDVFIVWPGEGFGQTGYRQFSLNPQQPEGFQQLLEDLQLREMTPTNIVYLWAMDETIHQKADRFWTLAESIQVWSRTTEPLQITVVTEAACDISGTEPLNPAQAEVRGLCQATGQEYPSIGCRQVDWVRSGQTPQQLAQTLWRELQVEAPPAVVAYRRGSTTYQSHHQSDRYRWQLTYQPVPLPRTDASASSQPVIRLQKGCLYALVGPATEASDGLSHVWASALAEHYQAQVVHLQTADASAMKMALHRATEKWGPLKGVFVSSPTTDERSAAPIALLQPDHWAYNCQTKRTVLENLAIALAPHAPDFCCVQSSLSAIIGGLGLAAYAGANHFIDAFVARQNQNSAFPWFSINWDAITHSENNSNHEKGKGDPLPRPSWGSALADFALTPAEVWQATERILTQMPPGQVIVSKGDLLARHQKWIRATPQSVSHEARGRESQGTAKGTTRYSRPSLSTAYVAPRNEVEEIIAGIWQDLLGLDKIGIDDSFFDLGGHSLLAIQALSRIREAFPVAVEMRNLLFEAPTVAGIAAVIAEQLPEVRALEEMSALLAEVQSLSVEDVQAQLAKPVAKPAQSAGGEA